MALLTVAAALAQLLADARPLDATERVPLRAARGRVLAETIRSTLDVPPADNSAMDGYALRTADLAGEAREFRVSQRIPAGSVGTPLEPGTLARIFTGAEIPPGADAVVMQEDCVVAGDRVTIGEAPRPGANIRRRGQDIAVGDVIARAGERLSAPRMGLLASVGITQVQVVRRLRVAMLSTGDELVEPGQPLGPGQIYNSNRYLLAGLLEEQGIEVVDVGMVADTAQATRDSLLRAVDAADAVISTGGVSVGEEDHVKAAVESLGSLRLWKIAIKPGKPLAYGRISGKPFIGLPGNPSSVFVTFTVFATPYLARMQGLAQVEPLLVQAIAGFDWPRPGKRQEYLRVRLTQSAAGLLAELHGNQSSGVLASSAWANGLVVLPPGVSICRGDPVTVQILPSAVA